MGNEKKLSDPEKVKLKYDHLQAAWGEFLEAIDRLVTNLLLSDDKENQKHLYDKILCKMEKIIYEKMLENFKGNQSQVARILGVSRGTLIARVKELEIDV